MRLYAMRDMRTIRRGMLVAIVMATGLNLLVFLQALASIVLFPDLPSGDQAMPALISGVLPPLLGAILLAAITAAMMSTVDSLLIVAGAAMLGGLAATLGWKAWGPESIDPVLAGFLVSAALLWTISRLSPPPPPEALAPYFPDIRAG